MICGSLLLFEALSYFQTAYGCVQEGENTPGIGRTFQIRVKAPARFNGLDIFQIEATTEMASVAPSRILPAITHAALTMIGPQVDNKNLGHCEGSERVIGQFNYTV